LSYTIDLLGTPSNEGLQVTILLTDREEQILKLVASGFTNKGIARQLSISEATVENHIHHIYIKLHVSNRAQAVAHAFQFILVQQDQILANRGNPS
jgi:DNA-binding NarL/FixJ family response regulator